MTESLVSVGFIFIAFLLSSCCFFQEDMEKNITHTMLLSNLDFAVDTECHSSCEQHITFMGLYTTKL